MLLKQFFVKFNKTSIHNIDNIIDGNLTANSLMPNIFIDNAESHVENGGFAKKTLLFKNKEDQSLDISISLAISPYLASVVSYNGINIMAINLADNNINNEIQNIF